MKPSTKELAKLQREIEHHSKAIAKHRDELRDLVEEAGQLSDNCDEAVLSLEEAIAKLSELV